MVGMFTGCGALVALLVFLPLPTRFQDAGHSPATAVADAFYVVGAIALVVALGVFFGLRKLPGEEGKGLKALVRGNVQKEDTETISPHLILSLPRQFWSSIRLGFQSRHIGLGYLGGFVARASSVAISLYIPLFTYTYFLNSGRCNADPEDPTDSKHPCPRGYKLAAALTGVSQLCALLAAPLFGFLSARYPRYNVPLLAAALAGVVGYSAFGSLASPDPRSERGSGAVFFIVALLGLSQIGAIVCSLSLLARGINNGDAGVTASRHLEEPGHPSGPPSVGPTPALLTPATEDAPLLANTTRLREASPRSNDLNHLKGSIAGTYSLLGGFGILLLTKAGGALFDTSGPGSPFFMMAAFNALLLVVGAGLSVQEVIQGWRAQG
jgi:MFS family permease